MATTDDEAPVEEASPPPTTKMTVMESNVREETMLEQQYMQETEHRDQLQLQIKDCQAELDALLAKQPKRPRDKLSELDAKIASLERDRTVNSIDLKDEREILRQMNKLERVRTEVVAFEEHDKLIKDKKSHIADLKDKLQEVRANADRLKTESRLAKTALQVGCKKEELVGTKVVCPQDKLGEVIGKKGSNVKQLQATASVTVNVLQEGDVRIVGSKDALDAATANLLKVISAIELSVPNPDPALVEYLASKNVTKLSELTKRHSDVRLSVQRHPKMSITLKGLPEDVERLRQELMSIEVVTKVVHMTDAESASVVGKKGAHIEQLTATHQVAIDVTRRRPSTTKKDGDANDNDDDEDKKKTDTAKRGGSKEAGQSTVTIIGPPAHVDEAAKEVEKLAALVREVTHSIDIDAVAKNAMLINGGAGMQALNKLLNDKKESGFVYATADGKCIVLRGRSSDVPTAVPVAEAEIRRVEGLTVTIPIDPAVVPTLIGKKGETIKSIRDGKPVVVEILDAGVVKVGGTEKSSVEAAVDMILNLLAGNSVRRMSVDSALYRRVSVEFIRNQARSIGTLCKVSLDNDKCQVVLRGEPDKVAEAEQVVTKFLANNYVEEVDVANEDLTVLLLGGKTSKITELSTSLEVRLSADKARNVVVVRGEQDKVVAAVKALKLFLFGGDGVSVVRVKLNEQVLGMVIGKGGKNKAELQKKYPSLSITVGSDNSILTLRGPEAQAESCRIELLKLVAGALVTESISISSKVHKRFSDKNKSRDLLRDIPVQFTLSDDAIKIRGYAPDVRDAVALVNEAIQGKYESRVVLPPQQFAQIKNACRNESSSPLQRAMDASSGASVVLDSTDDAVVFRGKRSQVKAAKLELFNFFDFLFGSTFARMELAGPLLTLVGRVTITSEISAVSGASIQLDRDTSYLLVFSNEAALTEKASEALKAKIDEASQLFFVLRFEPTEAVIVSSIVGKKGDQINKLRKSTKCDIEVDIDKRTVLVKSKSAEVTSKARSTLEALVDKIRRENVVIPLSDVDLPAFIGKAGSKIAEFADKYQVEAQAVRSTTPPAVRITGDEAAVAAAKAAALEWLKEREAARTEAETVETMRLRRDQVPAIIGTKGSTIRSLQSEFGCRVEVDREALIASVRGGNAEKRALVLVKIREILALARENSAKPATEEVEDSEAAAPASESTPPTIVKPDPPTEAKTPPRDAPTAPSAPSPKVPETSDFPELVSTPDRKVGRRRGSSDSNDDVDNNTKVPSSPPEIRSSATCSTVDSSSKDGDEDRSGVSLWSQVVVSSHRSPPREVAAGNNEERWADDAVSDASGEVEKEEEEPYTTMAVTVPAVAVVEP